MDATAIAYAAAVLGGLGILFGVFLSFADKKFAVTVDPRIEKITENLARANCGACGYPGCDQFAMAVLKGEAPVGGCTPGGTKTAAMLAQIMGVEGKQEEEPQVARLLCQGEFGVSHLRYEYDGLESCRAAVNLSGGPRKCNYACVGLGDCVRVCKFDAMKIVNGLVVIDEDKCTACGMCVTECPRDAIELLPRSATVTVRCRNLDTAKEAMQSCTMACIGCRRCEKACRFDAIHVVNNCAKIDTDKCTRCGECVPVCPTKCITLLEEP